MKTDRDTEATIITGKQYGMPNSGKRTHDPDPKPVRAEKPARRGRDPRTVKQATLGSRECWGCGKAAANGHHLIPRDFEKPGPDEGWNIIGLCGSGTSGCHGAFHGSPYSVETGRRDVRAKVTPALVRARILARLVHPDERGRLIEVMRFLGSSTLQERYFGRVLEMSPADIDELRRRYA